MKENIKDFILEDITYIKEREKKTRATEVEYSTVFVSGPDFAVRRKTAKTEKTLVVLPSKEQFFIRDEINKGSIEILDNDKLQRFLAYIPNEGFVVVDENGNHPFWMKKLFREKNWREMFLSFLQSDAIRPYLLNDMVSLSCLPQYHYRTRWDDCVIADIPFVKVKNAFDLLARNMDREEIKSQVSNGFNSDLYCLFNKSSQYANGGVVEILSPYDQIVERWGEDGVRRFIEVYVATPCKYFPNARQLYGLLNQCLQRENTKTGRIETTVVHTEYDLQSFLDYVFCECTRQGYADNPSFFWDLWRDYLNHQMTLFGELRDKYSKTLASDVAILSYRVKQIDTLINKEKFDKASSFLQQYEYSDGTYCIISPRSAEDLVEEGRQLSHCVGSSGKALLTATTMLT